MPFLLLSSFKTAPQSGSAHVQQQQKLLQQWSGHNKKEENNDFKGATHAVAAPPRNAAAASHAAAAAGSRSVSASVAAAPHMCPAVSQAEAAHAAPHSSSSSLSFSRVSCPPPSLTSCGDISRSVHAVGSVPDSAAAAVAASFSSCSNVASSAAPGDSHYSSSPAAVAAQSTSFSGASLAAAAGAAVTPKICSSCSRSSNKYCCGNCSSSLPPSAADTPAAADAPAAAVATGTLAAAVATAGTPAPALAVTPSAVAVVPLRVPAAASLGLPPPAVVPAALQQPPAEQHSGILASFFPFVKSQTEASKLRLAQKRYGYSLAELHAYPSMMELPSFPTEMLQQAALIRHQHQQQKQQKQTQQQQQQQTHHQQQQTHHQQETHQQQQIQQQKKQIHQQQQEGEERSFVAAGKTAGVSVDVLSDEEKKKTRKTLTETEKADIDTPHHLLFLEENMKKQLSKCHERYETIDRCVKQLLIHDAQSRHRYARLQECKLQWVSFNRCVSYRDQQLLRSISAWEKRHLHSLSPEQRTAYMEDMRAKIRYAEYVRRRTEDEQEALRRKREMEHLTIRLKNLEKLLQ